MGSGNWLRQRLLSAVALSLVCGAGIAAAQPGEDVVEIRIEAAPLAEALRTLSDQTGVPILFSGQAVAGRTAAALEGRYSPQAALSRLLDGSGLVVIQGQGNALVVTVNDGKTSAVPSGRQPPVQNTDAPADERPQPVDTAPEAPSDLRIGTVRVTGSSLRGIAPESSPLQVYGRDDILGSGVTSTEQFIRTLPQNFGGGSTEFAPAGVPGDPNSQRNNTYGTGANLRGLGAGATLTLLDGNRLAPTSTIGDFVDLSLIPVSALERVEVLTDGASSIYGGDAVAGVVNLVLRDDFEGAETSLRFGAVTEGDMQEYRLSQAAGTAWDSGNVLAVYEYLDRGRLSLADRPDIAAPPLTGGPPITETSGFDLLPEQTRHSLLLSGGQRLGDRFRLSSSLLYSDRQVNKSGIAVGSFTVDTRDRTGSETLTFNIGAEYDLGAGWAVSADGTVSLLKNDQSFQRLDTPVRDPVRFRTDSSLWAAGLLIDGPLLSLPGGLVRASIGGQVRQESFEVRQPGAPATRDGDRDVAALYGEVLVPLIGDGNAMPLVRRLELSLSARYDDYSDFGSTTNPKIGVLWAPVEGLKLRTSWSTSFAPPTVGQSGAVDRGAGVLPYDFIRGLLDIPLPDPSLEGVNYILATGTADALDAETSETLTAGFDYEAERGRHAWSVSGSYYDIDFENRLGTVPVPGNLNVNFAPGLAFADPSLFPAGTIIFFPSDAEVTALLDSLSRPPDLVAGVTAIENIGFINRVNLTRNLASTRTSGVDLQLGYEADMPFGSLKAGLNVNHIIDFVKQASDTTPSIETLNTLYNPVDLQLRANLGLSAGGFSGTFFVNHTASYRTDSTPGARPVEDWLTADLSLAYAFEPAPDGVLSGSSVSLSILNLFNDDPPGVPALSGFSLTGYDPANASPLGRFVALGVTKRF